MIMRMKSRLAAAIFGAGVLLVGAAFPAQAHDIRLYLTTAGCYEAPSGRCGYGQVRDNHEIVDTCDTFADGHGVYTRYRLLSGTEGRVSDPNGSASGCGIRRVGTYGTNPVVAIKVCVDQVIDECTNGWKIA